MDERELITQYYENDQDFPIKVIKIENHPDYGEHYYKVHCKNDENEFVNIVCVQDDMVLVVPE